MLYCCCEGGTKADAEISVEIIYACCKRERETSKGKKGEIRYSGDSRRGGEEKVGHIAHTYLSIHIYKINVRGKKGDRRTDSEKTGMEVQG